MPKDFYFCASKLFKLSAKDISFENTEIAFSGKSNFDLSRAYWLFRILSNNFLTRIAPGITNFSIKIGLPVIPIIKATVYKHFCGGTSISDCEKTIQRLNRFHIGTILDYSIEGEVDELGFDRTADEIIATIHRAKGNEAIPFTVFKITGIARFQLLEKMQSKEPLSREETQEMERAKARVQRICQQAFDAHVRIFIDAEESWIQDSIDEIALDMMRKYNRSEVIIYNTYQHYRKDRLDYLKQNYELATQEGFLLGAKLVRGAYMEKERKRASDMGYPSPIQETKEKSDEDYNRSLQFCVEHIDRIAICAGTHNEQSSLWLAELMDKNNIPASHPHIYFSQLLGMSDNMSYNLANAGYNVAKYVPYGPVKAVLPYLFRRANENTSIAGQTGRELSMIIREKKRRKA